MSDPQPHEVTRSMMVSVVVECSECGGVLDWDSDYQWHRDVTLNPHDDLDPEATWSGPVKEPVA